MLTWVRLFWNDARTVRLPPVTGRPRIEKQGPFAHPGLRLFGPGRIEAVCRLPEVFQHMNEIGNEDDARTVAFDGRQDMLELVLVPVHKHGPI